MKSPFFLAAVAVLGISCPATTLAKGSAQLQGIDFSVDTVSHFKIGPGLTQSKLVFTTTGRSFNAFVLNLDRAAAPGVRVKVDVGNDSCNTAERITSIAKRKTNDTTQYLAGINGDFFITSSFTSGHPLGNQILGYPNMSCVTEGKIIAPDIIDINSRENALIVGSDGMWIDATDLKYKLLNNDGSQSESCAAVNYPRQDNEVIVYNSYMGHYTKTTSQGREIICRLADGAKWAVNQPVEFVVDSDWHTGQSLIPNDGIVISCGPDYKNDFIDALKKGDSVKLEIELSLPAFGNIKPDILEVCGGDVRILKENVTTTEAIRWINTPSAKYSRSLVGYSLDRNHVVMCSVDASSQSSGVTYYEAADLMRYLGCYDALDLDGGGSTAIWSHSHGIFNHLRDGSERAVGNGLFFVLDADRPTDVTSIAFADHTVTLPRYGLYRPEIMGYNKHGQLVQTQLTDYILEAPQALGSITDNGHALLASGSGTHLLTVRCGDMTADIAVTIADATAATPAVKAFLLDGYHDAQIVLNATVGDNVMQVAPQAYTWTVEDPSVVTVSATGVLTGLKNGTTVVTGELGDSKIELPVTVERPEAASLSLFDNWNTADWTTTKSALTINGITANEDGGLTVDYTITGTRGTQLTLTNLTKFYSCPDGVELTYSHNTIPMTSVTLNIQPANAAKALSVNSQTVLEADRTGRVSFDIASAIDLSDPAVYPLQFKSLRFMPKAKTGTYQLKVNNIEGLYSYYSNSIDDITVPDGPANGTLICTTTDGGNVTLPFSADAIAAYTPAGTLVATTAGTDSVTLPVAGIYIIRATAYGKTFTARVAVK